MSVLTSQQDAMKAVIDVLVSAKDYADDPSNTPPDWTSVFEVDTVELEEYLISRMSSNPSFVESAVQEVYTFITGWNRDLYVRNLDRKDMFSEQSSSLENDIEYYTNLKELQAQYIKGRTPQQRS